MKNKKEKKVNPPVETSEEYKQFESVMKDLFNMTPERLEEIKKKVPYPTEERSEEEYNERISIYPPEE
jgi:hypothetical protein